MRSLITSVVLMVFLGMATGCAQEKPPAYDIRDTIPFQVRLPEGEKQGLMLVATGKWVIPPLFDKVTHLYAGSWLGKNYLDDVLAVKAGGRWGLVDKHGYLLVAPQYSAILYKGAGLLLAVAGGADDGRHLPATRGGKWGVLDRQGRVLIVPQFDFIGDFRDGMARIKEGDKYGYIDKDGRLAIPLQDGHTWGFAEGFTAVRIDGKYGYMDKTGQLVINPQYEKVALFSEGLAAVKVGGKWGYIDKTGTMVIAPQFTAANSFDNGLAAVRPSRKAGFINPQGELVVEPIFDDVILSEGAPPFGIIYEDNFTTSRCVLVGKSGTLITPWFEGAWPFNDGIAKIMLAGKIGFVDKTGKMVIEPQFSHASMQCQNGIVPVELEGKWGFRDNDGRWLAQPFFSQASSYFPRQRLVRDNGYFYDSAGKKLDHYANHIEDGYKQLASQNFTQAEAAFRAALRLNPDDEAARHGLSLAEKRQPK